MDCALPVVTDDGDLTWSDNHSMVSDDGHSIAFGQSPPWMDSLPTTSSSASATSVMSMSHTGQLSPISNGMDIPGAMPEDSSCISGSSSVPTMIHSASSSCTGSWSMGGEDAGDMACIGDAEYDNDVHWEQGSDDVLAVPKLEPLDDDDFRLEDVKEAPVTPIPATNVSPSTQAKVKRPRGRPRKHLLAPIVTANKITKGRSKTGCLTCRKRKKKCDEAKPRCMNCEKNAVVCEGYPEKQIWKSGKERAEEELLRLQSRPKITIQPIFQGLETVEDMVFWKHYNEHLSTVLTVEGEHKNAFKDMMVPIAVKHQGLMHSILSLSSKHIDYDTPYGMNLLKNNPNTGVEALQERSNYHHEKAVEKLSADIATEVDKTSPEYKDILSARYGQMLCLLLESIAEGNPWGEHRVHLQAYQTMIQHTPPEDSAFLTFITEFFQYHIFADELIRFPDGGTARLASEHWEPRSPIHPPRLLGVADGLFNYLVQITSIRNTIRVNLVNQVDPVVNYTSLYRAAEIDAAIREWTPRWPPGDSRDRVGLLYKQMMWVYLFRTIYPPSPSPATSSLTSSSTSFSLFPSMTVAPQATPINTPPHSTSPSCASSPRTDPRSNPPSRKNSGTDAPAVNRPHQNETRAESPAPIRHPPHHDSRVTLAVDESLAILESFKPSDPSQTLLLIPCLVIGTACFAPSQRERIRMAVRTVRGYTGLRNTDRVSEVLEEVWRLMDVGEWAAVWDWQCVAKRLGVDFLCT